MCDKIESCQVISKDTDSGEWILAKFTKPAWKLGAVSFVNNRFPRYNSMSPVEEKTYKQVQAVRSYGIKARSLGNDVTSRVLAMQICDSMDDCTAVTKNINHQYDLWKTYYGSTSEVGAQAWINDRHPNYK